MIGLSTGLACALLIGLWVMDELGMDQFHEKEDQLFQIIVNYQNPAGIGHHTQGLLAEALSQEIPEVEYAVASRLLEDRKTFSYEQNNIKVTGQYASPDYFNVFSYDLLQGSKDQVLTAKNSVVLSENMAMSLFGTLEEVVGKIVEFEHTKKYQVSGIFKDSPANSSVQFDFVLPYEAYKEINRLVLDWNFNSANTYLILSEGTDMAQFNAKIADFGYNKTDNTGLFTLSTWKYSDTYLYSNYVRDIGSGGRIAYVGLFSIIAIFILLIACVNFMNLSTAKASRRLKEIGIKKAIGAKRKTLVFQHLGESIAMAFLSLAISIILILIFLPQFNEITGKQLVLTFEFELVVLVFGIILLAGLTAGAYPAFYLSGFNAVNMLKGKLDRSLGELWTRKGLVVFQFTLSVILIVSVIVVYQQIALVRTQNLGYNRENILYMDKEGKANENLEVFLAEVRNIPGVVKASSMGQNIVGGRQNNIIVDQWDGKDP